MPIRKTARCAGKASDVGPFLCLVLLMLLGCGAESKPLASPVVGVPEAVPAPDARHVQREEPVTEQPDASSVQKDAADSGVEDEANHAADDPAARTFRGVLGRTRFVNPAEVVLFDGWVLTNEDGTYLLSGPALATALRSGWRDRKVKLVGIGRPGHPLAQFDPPRIYVQSVELDEEPAPATSAPAAPGG